MLPAVINFKLKLLLPMVRSSDGQEEGEDEGRDSQFGDLLLFAALSADWTSSNV